MVKIVIKSDKIVLKNDKFVLKMIILSFIITKMDNL